MNLEETFAQITLIRDALEESAKRLHAYLLVRLTVDGWAPKELTDLREAMEGVAYGIDLVEVSVETVPALLRAGARRLEPWAPKPGVGLTVAVAVLLMAADHAEAGATLVTADIVCANIREYTSSLVD